MTMPKFEPVAFVQSDPDGHLHLAEITKTEACQNLDQWDRQVGWKAVPLHTADQLTEAYEAGKREASEDIEQAAFEKWLYDKCPSGDVESVQRQWLESYEYAELAGKMEQTAQIEQMHQQLAAALAACKLKDEALEAAHNGLRWWMDAFPMHVTEADNEEMLDFVKALAIQPDDSALKAWLGEPIACYQGHDKASGYDIITLFEPIAIGSNLYCVRNK